ncbi:hypothetical protein [Telluria beijingensis]|uniref:hypothetical protein n=1 Tax=Telluria beijingensis TaxID=3068633 RepID=UPI0027952006|nr:hypothetical protein [Massilia sp. REN29]
MDLHESAGVPGAAGDTGLDPRTRIRIDLFLARRRAGPGATTLKILALRERGRAAGMNGAEMMASEAGDSHDAKASACLAYVAALLAHPGAPPLEALRRMHDAGFRPSDIDQVTGLVAADAEIYRDSRRTP